MPTLALDLESSSICCYFALVVSFSTNEENWKSSKQMYLYQEKIAKFCHYGDRRRNRFFLVWLISSVFVENLCLAMRTIRAPCILISFDTCIMLLIEDWASRCCTPKTVPCRLPSPLMSRERLLQICNIACCHRGNLGKGGSWLNLGNGCLTWYHQEKS